MIGINLRGTKNLRATDVLATLKLVYKIYLLFNIVGVRKMFRDGLGYLNFEQPLLLDQECLNPRT